MTTAWNQIVAIVLVCWVFGWTGGKKLIGESLAGSVYAGEVGRSGWNGRAGVG